MIRMLRAIAREPIVDVNAKCPACGHRDGKIKCVTAKVAEKGGAEQPMIEHTCKVCGATFHEPTVLQPDKWLAR